MIGCRQFAEVLMRNICQHIWTRQTNFLSGSCLGGNISLWTSRSHIIEPNKTRRGATKTPASATVSCDKLRTGFMAAMSFFSRMALYTILQRSRCNASGDNKIKVIKWTGNSLVMNPLDTFWDILKHESHSEPINKPLTTKRVTTERLIKVLIYSEKITRFCNTHNESMPDRIKAL